MCSWIEMCSPQDRDCAIYAGARPPYCRDAPHVVCYSASEDDESIIPEECHGCVDCLRAEQIRDVLDVFRNAGADRWNEDLSKIAECVDLVMQDTDSVHLCICRRSAREEASQDTCQPTVCESLSPTKKSCTSDSRCRLNCYYTLAGTERDGAETSSDDDSGGCDEFVVNWNRMMNNRQSFCEDQSGNAFEIIAAMTDPSIR